MGSLQYLWEKMKFEKKLQICTENVSDMLLLFWQ